MIASWALALWQTREANCTATYPLGRNSGKNRRRPGRCRRSGRGWTRTRRDSRRRTGHRTLRRTCKEIKSNKNSTRAQIKKKQKTNKTSQFLESCWLALRSQSATAWLTLSACFFFNYKQKHNSKASADSKRLFGTRRLGSLDHLILFNRSQSMSLWFMTSNKPNLVTFFLRVDSHTEKKNQRSITCKHDIVMHTHAQVKIQILHATWTKNKNFFFLNGTMSDLGGILTPDLSSQKWKCTHLSLQITNANI